MAKHEAGKVLSEDQRKEIFSALVDAQDHEMSVPQSRSYITERFNISAEQNCQIEMEGMAQHWPPL